MAAVTAYVVFMLDVVLSAFSMIASESLVILLDLSIYRE
jgi:hypothetical protein